MRLSTREKGRWDAIHPHSWGQARRCGLETRPKTREAAAGKAQSRPAARPLRGKSLKQWAANQNAVPLLRQEPLSLFQPLVSDAAAARTSVPVAQRTPTTSPVPRTKDRGVCGMRQKGEFDAPGMLKKPAKLRRSFLPAARTMIR
ncbi:hypothetical protein CSOJ01_00600 [Colletotrichum sojae]|uniref:Uncharacterized protein n=1 Tax=Colletotrichum sojae TaxID=2175907 RepID=A0A8H6N609_9PEZI|nr:hypothetical protein CSOJ01_00600 [Colletotrichum sojae]